MTSNKCHTLDFLVFPEQLVFLTMFDVLIAMKLLL